MHGLNFFSYFELRKKKRVLYKKEERFNVIHPVWSFWFRCFFVGLGRSIIMVSAICVWPREWLKMNERYLITIMENIKWMNGAVWWGSGGKQRMKIACFHHITVLRILLFPANPAEIPIFLFFPSLSFFFFLMNNFLFLLLRNGALFHAVFLCIISIKKKKREREAGIYIMYYCRVSSWESQSLLLPSLTSIWSCSWIREQQASLGFLLFMKPPWTKCHHHHHQFMNNLALLQVASAQWLK